MENKTKCKNNCNKAMTAFFFHTSAALKSWKMSMTINTNLKYIYFVAKIDVATLKMDIGKAHIVHL
jgi:hypothetical protein